MGAYTGSSSSMGSSILYAGGGAAAGAGAYAAVQKLDKAQKRASWGLGIGVALVALAAFSSSDLNADQTALQSLATQCAGLSFDASVTGLQVAALRSIVGQHINISMKMAYDANIFSFNGSPSQQPFPVQIAAITPQTITTTNNNNVIVLALAVLAVVLVVWS